MKCTLCSVSSAAGALNNIKLSEVLLLYEDGYKARQRWVNKGERRESMFGGEEQVRGRTLNGGWRKG